MTLEAAQKIVYKELGIWPKPCNRMEVGAFCPVHNIYTPHDAPMPPLDDGLLAVILRRLADDGVYPVLRHYARSDVSGHPAHWTFGCNLFGWSSYVGMINDPVTAAVLAFAQYLEARQ